MALNKKVREAEERANQIHQQVYGNTDQTPADQQVTQDQQQQQDDQKPPAVQQPVQQPEDSWEHKYRVLQGKYSAEVPRLSEEIRELKALVAELKEAKPAPEPQPQFDLKGMTPEAVVEQFGEDFASAVGAIAARIAEQQGNKFREEFAPKVEDVAKSAAKTARQEFMRELSAAVPDWQEIDVSDDFTAFLDEVDPLTGRSRRYFFNEADSQNNAVRVAQFFASFKGKKTVSDQQQQVPPRMSLENQLAPPVNQVSPNAPAAKKYWTQGDIRKFYQDVRRGLYTAEQGRLIEQDIFAAAQEGRMAA